MPKITVNGVTYDSVADMPPDVWRMYHETMAKLPALSDKDGDGIPDVVQGEGLVVRHGTTVRRKLVVNGETYEDPADMPPSVRAVYEQAMRAMAAGGPGVETHEVNLSFQIGGPGFSFRGTLGAPSSSKPALGVVHGDPAAQDGTGDPASRPIEPGSAGGGVRLALVVLAACVAGALGLWLLTRPH